MLNLLFLMKDVQAKQPVSYGRIYNVQDFIDESGGNDLLGIQRCVRAVEEHLKVNAEHHTIIFPSRLSAAYIINGVIQPQPDQADIWNRSKFERQTAAQTAVWVNIIGIRLSNDELEALLPDLSNTCLLSTYTPNSPLYLGTNVLGHGIMETLPIKELLDDNLCYTNMHCNLNPGSEHFLTYAPDERMPRIESVNTISHSLFNFRNDAAGPPAVAHATGINFMGLHLMGVNSATNSCVFNSNNAQHDTNFSYGIALNLVGWKEVWVDNLVIDDMYATGILVNNKFVVGQNGSVEIEDNVIRNVWALKYKQVGGGYDDGGDGICFQGIWQGKATRNYVVNNTDETLQFGRIGISCPSEYNKDVLIEHNQVSGYDRGIHVENNYGGFNIRSNRLTGSETALVFDSYQDGCPANNPSEVRWNYVSNEGVDINNSGLVKLYPPELFFTSAAFTSSLHNYSLFEKNYFLIRQDNIHQNYRKSGVHFVYPFSNTGGRWHIESGLRRMQIRCNVFETEGQGVNLANGGLNLLSSGPQPTAPEDPPNCLMPEDITMIHFPFTVVGNTFNNLNQLSINPYNNNVPHIIGSNLINNVSSTAPGSSIYTTSLVGEDTCAGKWNNTLCNGKPIVAEHDYLWDNDTLSGINTYSNHTILVGGVLTIDANLTFVNCTFLMASGSSMIITNGHTLTLNGCTLMAACDELWEGITADDASEQIIILNGCTLRDMNSGVQARNGARIEATGSTFLDNMTAMEIGNTPVGYVNGLPGNQGVVEGNTFSSTGAGVLYLQPSVSQGQYGLKLIGCAEVRIGAPPANGQGNRFSRVATGIFIQPDAQYPTAQYDLHNNQFSDIRQNPLSSPDVSAILQNTYGTPSGSAIYIRRMQDPVVPINWWTSTTPMVNIQGQNGVSAFARCDKAVTGIGSGVALTNYLINDCVAGLMVADAHYQNFNILNNTMNKVMAGVQLLGNLHYASIKANNISLSELNAPINLGNNPIPDPRGVDIQFWTNIHNGQCSIEGNTMTIPGIRGMGISLTKNGAQVAVAGNTVHFTTTNQTGYNAQLFTSPLLRGIYSALGDGNQLRCNVVNGLQSWAAFENRNSRAIDLWQSKQSEITCNQVNNTHLGISAMGNCFTTDKKVKANVLSNHVFGLSTWPGVLSDEGDLGDIGLSSHDNNNAFNGFYANADNYKTLRFYLNTNNLPVRYIYTQNLVTTDNGSLPTAGFGFYLGQATNPQNCLSYANCGSETGSPLAVTSIDVGLALEIAQDSMVYFLYPEVAEWAAKYELYSDLERDSVLLASNAILNSFYQTQMYQDLGIIRTVEQKLRVLTDSTTRNDSTLFAIRLQDAVQTNNSISGTQNYIKHEKWIHSLSFKIMEFGRDSLSNDELDSLAWLANSCPAAEGLAVYKARVLQAYYSPLAQYDDYALCNPASKGDKGPWDEMLRYLQNSFSAKHDQESGKSLNDIVKAYPNPTSDKITIEWNESCAGQGNVQLFDITGRLVLQKEFDCNSGSCELSMYNFPSGLYTYKLSVGAAMYTGKLSKHD